MRARRVTAGVVAFLVLPALLAPGRQAGATTFARIPVSAPAERAPRTVLVPAVTGSAAAALDSATTGDTVVLGPGLHRGPLRVVATGVTLRGEPGAIVDGGGKGSVITVAADGVTLEHLTLRASGSDVMKEDAAVQVLRSANVHMRDLVATDVLYGIYAERATGLEAERCTLSGRVKPMDESGDGNGIHMWYCTHAHLNGNRIERFLDAIYLSFANDVHVSGSLLQWNGRYGLHTMYCQSNRLERNVFTLNAAGCALMFSNGLLIDHNDFFHNRGPRTYGLLLRDCSAGSFTENRMIDNTIAVFMDNSNRNYFHGNLIENNGWGLLLFSSCAGNEFAGNNFIQNDYPVALDMRHTDNRFDDGHTGNYWSENPAYDLDADGVSDVPYGPVTAFAFISKQYPDLTILAKSPAVAALGVAERVLPAMSPSEAIDRFPLVAPASSAPSDRDRFPTTPSRPSSGMGACFIFLLLVGLAGISGAVRARVA